MIDFSWLLMNWNLKNRTKFRTKFSAPGVVNAAVPVTLRRLELGRISCVSVARLHTDLNI